jgi:hypothetical protein
MPNPKGKDSEGEWIELLNKGRTMDICGLVICDLVGSTKKYIVKPGTIIGAGRYLVFYSS